MRKKSEDILIEVYQQALSKKDMGNCTFRESRALFLRPMNTTSISSENESEKSKRRATSLLPAETGGTGIGLCEHCGHQEGTCSLKTRTPINSKSSKENINISFNENNKCKSAGGIKRKMKFEELNTENFKPNENIRNINFSQSTKEEKQLRSTFQEISNLTNRLNMIDSEKMNLFKKQTTKAVTSDFSQSVSSGRNLNQEDSNTSKQALLQPNAIDENLEFSRKNPIVKSNFSSIKSQANDCCESFYKSKTASLSMNEAVRSDEENMNTLEKEILRKKLELANLLRETEDKKFQIEVITEKLESLNKRLHEKEKQYDDSTVNFSIRLQNFREVQESEENRLRLAQQEINREAQKYERCSQDLKDKENKLMEREMELASRERRIQLNEKDIKRLTENLDEKSHTFLSQKLELANKIEEYNKLIEEIKDERIEMDHEKMAMDKKNEQMNEERERIKLIEEGYLIKFNELELRERETFAREKVIEEKWDLQRKKDQELQERELLLLEMTENFKKFTSDLNLEKEEREKILLLREEALIKREREVEAKEKILQENLRRDDEFELKLMGLQMNEELFKKKLTMEISNYQEEIQRLKERERKLDLKEQRLHEQEECLRKTRLLGSGEKKTNSKEIFISKDLTLSTSANTPTSINLNDTRFNSSGQNQTLFNCHSHCKNIKIEGQKDVAFNKNKAKQSKTFSTCNSKANQYKNLNILDMNSLELIADSMIQTGNLSHNSK